MARTDSNPKKRVVITGLGPVTPCGVGIAPFWEAVREGHSGVGYVTSFDASHLYSRIAGEVRDFDPHEYMSRSDARRSGRFVHFAVAASLLAVEDAGLELRRLDPFRVGAVLGTSVAGNGNVADDIYAQWLANGPEQCGPTDCVQMAPHAATAHVFIALGIKGPNASVATGCCAGLDAIATGRDIIRSGEADVMVVGASEACVSEFGMSLLCKTGVLSGHNEEPEKASRPYDATRDGLVLSEGGGALVLESADHAMTRGAHIYAEVLGHGSATEGQHLVIPDPSGVELARAFRFALVDSKLTAGDMDYVCAHGIGNPGYDAADTRAIKMVLGERAYNIPVSSIKSTTGQPFAAGGMWQAAASCMAMRDSVVPPTINYHHPDPECDLDYVPNQARMARVETAMINSHSFGGTHSALILRRYEERN
ncbi:MAG TPA: beta-ketoacyl-[acyl-carrier-protein] synthase family protein [Armatimonadota bacterium]|nr:beta-ketoacyl-[acyl-carrier-protein] synthase family protein [Armatimonadota bacterium]